MEKTCLIIGCEEKNLPFVENSTECDAFKDKTEEKLTGLIEEGINRFMICMRRGADTYAARLILKLKEKYPLIGLECILPFEEQATDWSERERDEYFEIIALCDKETLFQTKYTEGYVEKALNVAAKRADILLYIGEENKISEKRSEYISA